MVTGTRIVREGAYWNANGYATAIVAVITEGIDWSAYAGGAPVEINEEAAVQFVARKGTKISKKLARIIFPDIELPYRD